MVSGRTAEQVALRGVDAEVAENVEIARQRTEAGGSRQPRGLGHLMPYGDDNVHPIAVLTPDQDRLVT